MRALRRPPCVLTGVLAGVPPPLAILVVLPPLPRILLLPLSLPLPLGLFLLLGGRPLLLVYIAGGWDWSALLSALRLTPSYADMLRWIDGATRVEADRFWLALGCLPRLGTRRGRPGPRCRNAVAWS
ncbi:hypothetical protein QBC45DRAFT_31943 [Copromyces sp. CBS 386.78]|nr:hypothetical protein QBC45DRAFT_31943 [Copromyces sp. CBS 386.78]